MRFQVLTILVPVLLSSTRATNGGPILTYDFTGRVTSISDNTAFDLNGSIPLNTTVTGSVVYDAGAPGNVFPHLGGTAGVYPGAALSFSVNVGSGLLVWDSGPLDFFGPSVTASNNIVNGSLFYDLIAIQGGSLTPASLVLPSATTTSTPFALLASLVLIDFSATALSDSSLPSTLDPSLFDFTTFSLTGGRPSGTTGLSFPGSVNVSVDSLVQNVPLASVPEPGSIMLFGLGTVGLVLRGRRNRRR